MKKQNINLMDSFLAIEKRKSAKTDRLAIFGAIFIAIVLLLGAYTFKLLLDTNSLRNEIKETEEFVNDPILKERIAIIELDQLKITDLKDIDVVLDQLNATFGAFPRVNTLLLRKLAVNMPVDSSFKSIAFNGQLFTIYIYSTTYLKPSEYAVRLQNTNFFEEVIYGGYTSEASPTGTRYVGKVTVILKVGN